MPFEYDILYAFGIIALYVVYQSRKKWFCSRKIVVIVNRLILGKDQDGVFVKIRVFIQNQDRTR